MSTTFTARYNGRCAASCGYGIEAGEEVTYVDDQLVHTECNRDVKLKQKNETVCNSCWLVQPCDCEES